jgi:hypothetical protein
MLLLCTEDPGVRVIQWTTRLVMERYELFRFARAMAKRFPADQED